MRALLAALALTAVAVPLLLVSSPPAARASTALGQAVVAEAARHAGAPYVYGAAGPNSFDCSGFTSYVYRKFGIELPRTAAGQSAGVPHIPQDQRDLGDLLFFYGSGGVTHVAIYAGNNMMWAAPHTGDVVKLQSVYTSSYYVGRPGGGYVAAPPPPPTAIQAHWSALGGAGGSLGSPVTPELRTPDGSGAFTHYSRGGSIYWTPATGARAVLGAIRTDWSAQGWEAGSLGYPTTDELGTANGRGRYNHFTGRGTGPASIYWSPATGAHAVYGSIRTTWAAYGWENGAIGFPTTDESGTPDRRGRYNHFDGNGMGASVYWTPQTGSHVVLGSIRGTWGALGWEAGQVGYPVTDELATPDRVGRFSHFDGRGAGASIYWTPATGAHAVVGAIRGAWAAQGWEQGRLGYPTSSEFAAPGGLRRSNFAHGYITYNPATNSTAVHAA